MIEDWKLQYFYFAYDIIYKELWNCPLKWILGFFYLLMFFFRDQKSLEWDKVATKSKDESG